jgi:hypothetical protein
MSEREKQIRFLKALACREASTEFETLQDKIHNAERHERCVRRMIFLVFVLMMLSVSSICYGTVFQPQYLRNTSQLMLKLPCSFGLASLMCLLGYTGYWFWHRAILNKLYAQCRQLIIKK